jgi:predicted nucleic acid-binding protein
VNGYLMDTNHVTAWEAEEPGVVAKVQSLPKETLIFTSAIAIGEIYAGHEMTSGDLARRHKVRHFLNLNLIPYVVPITEKTAPSYGEIMGRIWQHHPPPLKPKRSTDLHLAILGINVNDVWIAASAWERGLILLTEDAMPVIRHLVPEVKHENWIQL